MAKADILSPPSLGNLAESVSQTTNNLLFALSEVEAQRDQVLAQVERLGLNLQFAQAENAALKARLGKAHEVPKSIKSSNHAIRPSVGDGSWCRRCWLFCGGNLASAEQAFDAGKYEMAVKVLDNQLKSVTDEEEWVNIILLKAKAISYTDSRHDSIQHFRAAKELARQLGCSSLRAKVFFHEGIYHFENCSFHSALLAFAAATETSKHEREVEVWKHKTRERIRQNLAGKVVE